ncbi:MAG: helix-turn-helix domain-containing protein [Jatrophihabitantaceae bacterium]
MPTTPPAPTDRSRPERRSKGRGSALPPGGGRSRGEPVAARRHEFDLPGRRELLLDLLRASAQPRTILSLADEVGVHANTVRFHIETLLRAGQVERLLGDTIGPGRPPVLFRATRRMNPDGPTNYRLLASMLTSHLATSSPDPAAAAAELGRAWGPHLLDPATAGRAGAARVKRGEALNRMTRVLSDLGFAPESSSGPRVTTIRLRHCPFLSLVTGIGDKTGTDTDPGRGYGSVICSLHLGLMQGALAALRGPVTVDRLEPFVEPDLCVAHLARAGTASYAQAPTLTPSRTNQ